VSVTAKVAMGATDGAAGAEVGGSSRVGDDGAVVGESDGGGAGYPSPLAAMVARLSRSLQEHRSALQAHPYSSHAEIAILISAEAQRRALLGEIAEIDRVCAAKAVHLLPGAARRLAVLEQLGYLLPAVSADESAAESADESADEAPGSRLSLKGRVACVLTTTADSLILTEAVCTGLLHPLSVPECCALLSTFVAKGKLRTAPKLPPALVAAHESLLVLARRLATLQVEAGVLETTPDEHVSATLNTALMGAAFHWASGASFEVACQHTDLSEGDVVRILSRTEELCKEVRAAARLLGDALLAKKLDELLAAIRRDLVAAPSLYTTGGMAGW